MSPGYGILLFVIGMLVTVIFFMVLFWAMDDRPKVNTEEDENNPVIKFNKRFNSLDKS